MASKKKFPKDGIPRSRVRPRQSKRARETYGKGFNVRGTPTTCGYPTEWGGQCAAYVDDGGPCMIHWEEQQRKRKTQTRAERQREIEENTARAARSVDRLRQQGLAQRAEREGRADA
jgi:hypothetical protein